MTAPDARPDAALSPEERKGLIRRAMVLVWIGELWNVVEAGVALVSGAATSSVALIAFGSKSVIELFLGAILIWQLRREWRAEHGPAGERTALRILGFTFFVLSAYILLHSVLAVTGVVEEPGVSRTGLAIVLASAAVMTLLYSGKIRLARALDSRSLRAEAIATLVCDLQDLTVFVGLGLNALFGWWWADAVAAVLLIPFLLREGREAWEGEETAGESPRRA